MYSKGDVVVYGLNGICEITDISTLKIKGIPNDKEYYTLQNRSNEGTIYVPVDSAFLKMRSPITKYEAEELISKMPTIEPLANVNKRFIEAEYRECLLKFDYEAWISLIKYIYYRKQKRLEAGKKTTTVDEKYLKKVEDILYQELALALEIPRDEVINYIIEKIENNNK